MDNKIQLDHFISAMKAGSEFPIGHPSGEEYSSSDNLPPDAMPLLLGSHFSLFASLLLAVSLLLVLGVLRG
jgi:hypothetical protein